MIPAQMNITQRNQAIAQIKNQKATLEKRLEVTEKCLQILRAVKTQAEDMLSRHQPLGSGDNAILGTMALSNVIVNLMQLELAKAEGDTEMRGITEALEQLESPIARPAMQTPRKV
jgi:hypothetical protein